MRYQVTNGHNVLASRFYLGAFGATAQQDVQRFADQYNTLRAQIVLENTRAQDPVPWATLNANLERMDGVFRLVLAGEYDRAPSLVNTARGILAAVGMTRPTNTMETVLRSLLEIPAMLKTAVVETARTAGQAASAFGLDPTKIAEDAGTALKAVGLGLGLVGGAIILFKLL